MIVERLRSSEWLSHNTMNAHIKQRLSSSDRDLDVEVNFSPSNLNFNCCFRLCIFHFAVRKYDVRTISKIVKIIHASAMKYASVHDTSLAWGRLTKLLAVFLRSFVPRRDVTVMWRPSVASVALDRGTSSVGPVRDSDSFSFKIYPLEMIACVYCDTTHPRATLQVHLTLEYILFVLFLIQFLQLHALVDY